jgi:hypothetical protein
VRRSLLFTLGPAPLLPHLLAQREFRPHRGGMHSDTLRALRRQPHSLRRRAVDDRDRLELLARPLPQQFRADHLRGTKALIVIAPTPAHPPLTHRDRRARPARTFTANRRKTIGSAASPFTLAWAAFTGWLPMLADGRVGNGG